MKEREHLTKNQIIGYRAGTFDAPRTSEIGRHLLKCETCRRQLPPPTFDDFWNAVMSERETEQTSASEELEQLRHSGFSAFPKIFGRLGGLAWSGGALMVLFIFALLLWFNAGRELNQENEIAQTFNINATESNPAQIESGEQILPLKNSRDDQISSSDSNLPAISKSSQPNARQNNSNSLLRENTSRNSARVMKKDAPNNVSSTRGGGGTAADCGGELTVKTEIGLGGEAVTLKWKKVLNAVKYQLYISDDEEILIDEYETERETSYTLTKPLDASRTYRWKVVVTTEDGKTIAGDSQKFTVKNLPSKRSKSAKKEKSLIRCSQND
jgi:hypothetical protein